MGMQTLVRETLESAGTGITLPKLGTADVVVKRDLLWNIQAEHLSLLLGTVLGLPMVPGFPAFIGGEWKWATIRIPNARTLGQAYGGYATSWKVFTDNHWDLSQRIFAFDLLIGNIDRHDGNLLVDSDDKVWLIDHGLALDDLHSTHAAIRYRVERDCLLQNIDEFRAIISDSLLYALASQVASWSQKAPNMDELYSRLHNDGRMEALVDYSVEKASRWL
jgi:hypothetical protein